MATGTERSYRNSNFQMERLDIVNGTGTTSSNAVTINAGAGVITTESLTTAAGASQAITLTNSFVAATDMVFVTINGGTSTTGSIEVRAVPGAGSVTITLYNRHASAAFNGTFILAFLVVKKAA